MLVDDFVSTAQVLSDPGPAIPYHVLIIIYNLTIHMHDLHVIGRNHIPRKSVLGS